MTLLPDWLLGDGKAPAQIRLRALGTQPADLEIDFSRVPRPELVTDVLARCVEYLDRRMPEEDLVLRMPVGLRVELLLRLAGLSDERPFAWRTRCTQPACGNEAECELGIAQILSSAGVAWEQPSISVAVDRFQLTLSRPTAANQRHWMAAGEVETIPMLRDIIRTPDLDSLLTAGISTERLSQAVDEAMDSFDPLPGFHFNVVCPHCGATYAVAPDLTAAALERLAGIQQRLMEEVHRLASRYHWSEAEILELPEWRRRSYLELVEQEVA